MKQNKKSQFMQFDISIFANWINDNVYTSYLIDCIWRGADLGDSNKIQNSLLSYF